jgi:hypothetical protein
MKDGPDTVDSETSTDIDIRYEKERKRKYGWMKDTADGVKERGKAFSSIIDDMRAGTLLRLPHEGPDRGAAESVVLNEDVGQGVSIAHLQWRLALSPEQRSMSSPYRG